MYTVSLKIINADSARKNIKPNLGVIFFCVRGDNTRQVKQLFYGNNATIHIY